jgi:hypothetical protein
MHSCALGGGRQRLASISCKRSLFTATYNVVLLGILLIFLYLALRRESGVGMEKEVPGDKSKK